MNEIIETKNHYLLTLTLNRPAKRNALNARMIESLKCSLRNANNDEDLRAVIIEGAGKDFCSGADLSALKTIAESDILENLDDAESLMDLFLLIRSVKIPVIAAVHGRALAGGCGLATACDIVVASSDAQFGYPEVKIGFVPAMVMAILRRNVSEKQSFELVTQGFNFTAAEALKMGLINQMFDARDFANQVLEYASVYQKVSRSAVILSKKLLYQMDGQNFESALTIGAEVNAIARLTDDCKSGIAKFLEKT